MGEVFDVQGRGVDIEIRLEEKRIVQAFIIKYKLSC